MAGIPVIWIAMIVWAKWFSKTKVDHDQFMVGMACAIGWSIILLFVGGILGVHAAAEKFTDWLNKGKE